MTKDKIVLNKRGKKNGLTKVELQGKGERGSEGGKGEKGRERTETWVASGEGLIPSSMGKVK